MTIDLTEMEKVLDAWGIVAKAKFPHECTQVRCPTCTPMGVHHREILDIVPTGTLLNTIQNIMETLKQHGLSQHVYSRLLRDPQGKLSLYGATMLAVRGSLDADFFYKEEICKKDLLQFLLLEGINYALKAGIADMKFWYGGYATSAWEWSESYGTRSEHVFALLKETIKRLEAGVKNIRQYREEVKEALLENFPEARFQVDIDQNGFQRTLYSVDAAREFYSLSPEGKWEIPSHGEILDSSKLQAFPSPRLVAGDIALYYSRKHGVTLPLPAYRPGLFKRLLGKS